MIGNSNITLNPNKVQLETGSSAPVSPAPTSAYERQQQYSQRGGNASLFGTSIYDNYLSQYQQFISQYESNPELYQRLKDLYQFNGYIPNNGELFWGDTSGFNDFYTQSYNTAMDNARQLIDEYNQRSYNSPVAQEQRMDAAGINSSLAGSDAVKADQAGDATPEPIPQVPNAHDTSGAAAPFNFAKDIFTQTLGVLEMVQGFGIRNVTKVLGDLDINDKAYRIALGQEAGKIVGRKGMYKNADGTYDWSKIAEDTVLQGELDPSTPKKAPKLHGAAKALDLARKKLYYDENGVRKPSPALQQAISSMDKSLSDNILGYAQNLSMPGYSVEGIMDFASQLSQTQTEWRLQSMKYEARLRELEVKVKELEQPAVEAKSKYEADYYGTEGLGRAEGEAAKSTAETTTFQNKAKKLRAEYEAWREDSINSLYKKVYGNGEWYNKVGVMFLPGVVDDFSTMSTRFLDKLDGLFDLLINPAAKMAGGVIKKALF